MERVIISLLRGGSQPELEDAEVQSLQSAEEIFEPPIARAGPAPSTFELLGNGRQALAGGGANQPGIGTTSEPVSRDSPSEKFTTVSPAPFRVRRRGLKMMCAPGGTAESNTHLTKMAGGKAKAFLTRTT